MLFSHFNTSGDSVQYQINLLNLCLFLLRNVQTLMNMRFFTPIFVGLINFKGIILGILQSKIVTMMRI